MNEEVMRLIIRLAGMIEFASESSIAPDKRTGWQAEIARVLTRLDDSDREVFASFARDAASAEEGRWRDWYINFPDHFGLTDDPD
jgi:hypothetical protein